MSFVWFHQISWGLFAVWLSWFVIVPDCCMNSTVRLQLTIVWIYNYTITMWKNNVNNNATTVKHVWHNTAVIEQWKRCKINATLQQQCNPARTMWWRNNNATLRQQCDNNATLQQQCNPATTMQPYNNNATMQQQCNPATTMQPCNNKSTKVL